MRGHYCVICVIFVQRKQFWLSVTECSVIHQPRNVWQSDRHILSLRAETVSISGGIILFLIAIKMIFPSASGNSSGLPAGEEPFIVPLAIPLVAGPTILATLMLLSHQYPNQMGHLVIALLLAWGGTFVILLQSSLFLRLLGEKGVNALERLMGLILVMMATQMFLDGIRMWMKG